MDPSLRAGAKVISVDSGDADPLESIYAYEQAIAKRTQVVRRSRAYSPVTPTIHSAAAIQKRLSSGHCTSVSATTSISSQSKSMLYQYDLMRLGKVQRARISSHAYRLQPTTSSIHRLSMWYRACQKTSAPTASALVRSSHRTILRFVLLSFKVKLFADELREVLHKVLRRSLRCFITAAGSQVGARFGLGPDGLRMGDKVFVIIGVHRAVILCQIGRDRRFKYIENSHMNGLMEGEALWLDSKEEQVLLV